MGITKYFFAWAFGWFLWEICNFGMFDGNLKKKLRITWRSHILFCIHHQCKTLEKFEFIYIYIYIYICTNIFVTRFQDNYKQTKYVVKFIFHVKKFHNEINWCTHLFICNIIFVISNESTEGSNVFRQNVMFFESLFNIFVPRTFIVRKLGFSFNSVLH